MQLVSYLAQGYFAVPFERFTEKIVRALALFYVIEKPDSEGHEEVKFIEMNTDAHTMVSVYKLDRVVNPTKGQFNACVNKAKFIKNNKREVEIDSDGDKYIELTEDEIHERLCYALRRVNDIIAENLKDYDIEMKIPRNSESDISANEFENAFGEGNKVESK